MAVSHQRSDCAGAFADIYSAAQAAVFAVHRCHFGAAYRADPEDSRAVPEESRKRITNKANRVTT